MNARLDRDVERGPSAGRDGFALAMSTGLWTGLVPFAPGTCGTLPGVALHLLAAWLLPAAWLKPALLLLFLAACLASIHFAPWAMTFWKTDDPKHFVLDEVAGYLLTVLLFVPSAPLWPTAAWGFALFRLFDVLKPPPAGWIDRNVKGPRGILLDDLAAAVLAAGCLYLLRWAAAGGIPLAGWLPGPV
ncbi:MAG TPA: phosphatidylglycerophosphatase A [Candidatus Deferrimicrobiaceae bacterium]